jgi:hypothetical protein
MTLRAAGCGLLGVVAFVAIGLFGIWRASAPPECPGALPYEPAAYRPVGEPASEPSLEGATEPLERAGSTSFGLARWDVYVEPGFAPAASGDVLPQRIVLDCGNGQFQAYHRGTE